MTPTERKKLQRIIGQLQGLLDSPAGEESHCTRPNIAATMNRPWMESTPDRRRREAAEAAAARANAKAEAKAAGDAN